MQRGRKWVKDLKTGGLDKFARNGVDGCDVVCLGATARSIAASLCASKSTTSSQPLKSKMSCVASGSVG